MNQSKLPADPTTLILGITGLVLGFAGCCCYGIVAIVPLIISIIGLVLANGSLKEYRSNPEAYSQQTKSNVSTGKILNIIAIVFNGIVVLFFVGTLIFYGTMLSSVFLDKFKNFENFENGENYEFENDTLFDDSEYYESEDIIDTVTVKPLQETYIEGDDINK